MHCGVGLLVKPHLLVYPSFWSATSVNGPKMGNPRKQNKTGKELIIQCSTCVSYSIACSLNFKYCYSSTCIARTSEEKWLWNFNDFSILFYILYIIKYRILYYIYLLLHLLNKYVQGIGTIWGSDHTPETNSTFHEFRSD